MTAEMKNEEKGLKYTVGNIFQKIEKRQGDEK